MKKLLPLMFIKLSAEIVFLVSIICGFIFRIDILAWQGQHNYIPDEWVRYFIGFSAVVVCILETIYNNRVLDILESEELNYDINTEKV